MRHRWWVGVLAVVAIGTLAALGWSAAYQFHAYRNEQILAEDMSLVAPGLTSELSRFTTLSDVLREDPRIRAALDDAGTQNIPALSAYLGRMQKRTGAVQIFVLNKDGIAIAASDWQHVEGMPPLDLSFRPYFKDAMESGRGIFFGFTYLTGLPNLFIASSVDQPAGRTGVIVVKLDLDPIETSWWGINAGIALADRTGVVFLSNHKEWKYRPLEALSPDTLDTIVKGKQFEGINLAERRPLFDTPEKGQVAVIAGEKYMFQTRSVGEFGWQVVIARPFSRAQSAAGMAALAIIVAGLIITGIILIYYQRGQLVRITSEQSALLEKRVEERTRELAAEVEIRRRAEENLRAAEDDLVQATKLATLGQMSAALAHEVSQPVAALAALLTAADRRLDNGEINTARRLVERSQSLTQRLQHIIRHLRSFARKEPGKRERVDLAASISAALELAETRAREIGVSIVTPGLDRSVEVFGNTVRLEQVLINLLLNALDAVAGCEKREVGISLETEGETAIVRVWDTGPGIPEEFGEKLSQPFFTTKTDQDGLGLGLSISHSILVDYGAKMRFLPREGGGTVCEVRLPLVVNGKQIEAAE